jgi:2-dehydropantoate 2-reductase
MYRDLLNQSRVEVDTILGELLERGEKHQVPAPILHAAFVGLTIYQNGRIRAKGAAPVPKAKSFAPE